MRKLDFIELSYTLKKMWLNGTKISAFKQMWHLRVAKQILR